MTHTGKGDQKIDCLSNSRANTPRGVRISLSDVICDRSEMPERP
jgi:hypothetical protein